MGDRPEDLEPDKADSGEHKDGTSGSSKEPIVQRMRKVGPKVVKTVLDRDTYSKLFADVTGQKRQEQLERSAPGETKPLKAVQNYKKAAPCHAAWDQLAGTGKIRFCEDCKLQVYDLQNMDQKEAEVLVMQRENKQSPVLFKRADGKFLTADCPVGVRKKFTKACVSAAFPAILALIASLILMMPPLPKPTVQSTTTRLPMQVGELNDTLSGKSHRTPKEEPRRIVKETAPPSADRMMNIGAFPSPNLDALSQGVNSTQSADTSNNAVSANSTIQINQAGKIEALPGPPLNQGQQNPITEQIPPSNPVNTGNTSGH